MRGYEIGFGNGYQKGYETGDRNGFQKGHEVGYQKAEGEPNNTSGYKDEEEYNYKRGYDDGYNKALDDVNVKKAAAEFKSASAAEPDSATTDSWSKPDVAESAQADREVSPFDGMGSAPSKLQLRAPPGKGDR